jgi:hypothetical protein
LTAIENIGVYLLVRKTKNKRKLCIDDFYAVIYMKKIYIKG